MQGGNDDLTGRETITGYPNLFEERGPTSLRGNVVSLGEMAVYYRSDSCMKTTDKYYL
jgi:hypothetical protein